MLGSWGGSTWFRQARRRPAAHETSENMQEKQSFAMVPGLVPLGSETVHSIYAPELPVQSLRYLSDRMLKTKFDRALGL